MYALLIVERLFAALQVAERITDITQSVNRSINQYFYFRNNPIAERQTEIAKTEKIDKKDGKYEVTQCNIIK